jgi:uncharacterized membrane protein YjjB (DUF3815 family)
MIIQSLAAFFGTILFSVFFNISRKELIFCGLNGITGWISYLVIDNLTISVVLASLVATLVVCIIAQVLAKLRKNPVTVFQIAGIIPLVPGLGMYQTLYAVVINDYPSALEHLVTTVEIAAAIAIGMLMITSLYKALKITKAKQIR